MKQNLGKRIAGIMMSAAVLFAAAVPVQAAGNSAVTVQIPVTQEFTVSGTEETDGEFSYLLTGIGGDAPMPAGSVENVWRFSVTDSGNVRIPIEFTHAGVFTYELRLDGNKAKNGYTYDGRIYTLSIYVSNVESGLAADLIVQNENGDKASEIVFKNSYTAQDAGGQITSGKGNPQHGSGGNVKTGDTRNMIPVFSTALVLSAWIIAAVLKKRAEYECE